MYQDLKQNFWWTRMKREIATYVSECDTCQRVKASHLKVADTLQPLPIPSWKWEDISMDFIVGLPRTPQGHDSIWTAHFILINTAYAARRYAEIYLERIVCLHGVPRTIISDCGTQFVARFWEQLQLSLGTKLIRSSAYHPQTDGQTERVNQILEDMLRACVIHYGKNWENYLSLAEFSYNNSYQASLKMAPFEALYGRRCRTPLCWSQAGERYTYGPDLVKEAEEKVRIIRENLETAQSRQKSYSDRRRKSLQFEAGDHVYLKVSLTKGVQRFGLKGKLASRYIGPYEITQQCGPVGYRVKLPEKLSTMHNVFHLSQLKKCHRVPTEVVQAELELSCREPNPPQIPPPFPNSPCTELDHFLSFLFPHFSQAPLNSPARNRDFPQNPHFRPPEHLHVKLPLRAIPDANRASQPPPTPVKATDLAGVEAAAAAPPLLRRRRPPSVLRPPNRHHSTRGELLVLFPHLSDLLPPSFGRRNAADEPRAYLHLLPFRRRTEPTRRAIQGEPG
nr:unnamed protein product [Digitaria exilis]